LSDPSLGKRLFRGATYLYGAQLLSIPLGIVTALPLGRFVIPSDFGAFAIATMMIGFTSTVTDARLITVLVRHEREPTQGELASVFWF
jgi:O-antigen/teichoic acid export membrane protein